MENFYIWEGMYPDFQSAMEHAKGPGFSGDVYLNRSLEVAKECLAALNSEMPIPAFHKQRSTYLSPIVAMMLVNKKQLEILDFGGGLGIGWMTLAESIPAYLERVSYTILEMPAVSNCGAELHKGEIKYISEIPKVGKFDLIHAASSFQYIENWQELIKQFVSLNPDYILLSDVFAGLIKPYATLQNYYESRIPHWFLNLNELLDAFHRYGYRLTMKCYTTSRRLDVEDILPMDNFDEAFRLTQSLHLLLKKNA